MNWEAIGAVGETLGAGIVAITLLFLMLQIRQNTNSVRTQTMFNVIHEANAINAMIAKDAETARIFEQGQNQIDALSTIEQVQFQALVRTVVNLANAGYLARTYGVMHEGLWEGLRDSAGDVAMTEGGRRFLQANVRYFGEDFADEIAPPAQSSTFEAVGWSRDEPAPGKKAE